MRFFLAGLVTVLALAAACGGDDGDSTATPTATGGRSGTTTGSTTASPAATDPTAVPTRTPRPVTPTLPPAPGEDAMGDQRLYLSLGDSLAEGRGASDAKRTAWVPLVALGLGPEYELLNLGVAGYDSGELIDRGQLDDGIRAITDRANDGVPGNEVGVITLEIGGNDLLDIYDDYVLTGICPTVQESLPKEECVNALQSALDGYQPNLDYILDQLQAAAPGVPLLLMTLYNPFSGGSYNLDRIGALALEGEPGTPFETGMNDVIRGEAASHPGVTLVEWYDLFLGKQSEYISLDLIHPNDVGQRAMADRVLAALGR